MISFIEAHLALITLVLGLIGSGAWWKFSQDQNKTDVEKDIEDLKESVKAHQKDVSETKDRIGNIEVAIQFMKDDMKLVKDFILKGK